MHTDSARITTATATWSVMIATLCLLLIAEPALANKFETIGSGVSGSIKIKREWLSGFFVAAGGIALISAFAAVFVPHRNPLFLNFSTWKQSAVILFILATLLFGAAIMI